jgi:crotonobetainyl-CoA:carnitine CoA-transferase CaiB-like acyl-CoA transferase
MAGLREPGFGERDDGRTMGDGALDSIVVLDLTQGVAGPYATKYYSDYGATVIKVERPGSGDPARRLGPFVGDIPSLEASGMFLHLNTGKQSVTLNLKTESGRRILRRLAAQADIVFENFRPGTLARLGLGSDALREVNPRAALVQISNFGQTGPYRDFAADDLLAYAMGGVLQVTGEAGRAPVKLGLYTPLFIAGVVAVALSLGAYLGSRRDGVGERVDFSITEMLAASMDRGAPNLVAYQYSGELQTKRESIGRMNALPNGIYPCADGYVHINAQVAWWPRMCRAIGRTELIDDPEYTSRLTDLEAVPDFDALIYPWLLERTKQDIMEAAQAVGLPISALNTMEDVFRDPHLRAREFFQAIDHPVAGLLEYAGPPFRMLGTPADVRRAPLLGEHTSQVLRERLGYTREQVVRLRQTNVI